MQCVLLLFYAADQKWRQQFVKNFARMHAILTTVLMIVTPCIIAIMVFFDLLCNRISRQSRVLGHC